MPDIQRRWSILAISCLLSAITADALGQERVSSCRKPANTESYAALEIVNFIEGGQAAPADAYPFIVSLGLTGRTWPESGGHFCGGVIIEQQTVLTAAHCLFEKGTNRARTADEITVRYGTHDLTQGGVLRVDRLVPHPRYRSEPEHTGYFDIAVIKLAEPIPDGNRRRVLYNRRDRDALFVRPDICATAIGWGVTGPDLKIPQVLQHATLPVVDHTICDAAYPEKSLTAAHLCAGYPAGGISTCGGDSGGPLAIELPPFGWVLLGLVAFGRADYTGDNPRVCALEGAYPVFTRVSDYADWIAETADWWRR